MPNTITNPKFFSAGNAVFTISNESGEHLTFKIRKGKGQWEKFFAVFYLTGPDNTSSYTYLGKFNPYQLRATPTAKSVMVEDAKPFRVLNWAVKQVAEHKELPIGYNIQHEGKCCRCGRRLTTPTSIDNGIGPECIKYFQ